MYMKIINITSLEILDSRGLPTIKTYIHLEDGSIHSSAVPSGASTGRYEATEKRDSDTGKIEIGKRYLGCGVLTAIENVSKYIKPNLIGMDCENIKEIDSKMIEIDGTEYKNNLGANAILSVSQAMVRAGAHSQKKHLWKFINEYYNLEKKPSFPGIFVNVINGGKHADWNFPFQEFLLKINEKSISDSIRIAAEIFGSMKIYLKSRKYSTLVGDEGGYSPPVFSNIEACEVIKETMKYLPYDFGTQVMISIDSAASEFFNDGKYTFKKNGKDDEIFNSEQLLKYYKDLSTNFPIYSIEDPFDQEDWATYKKITNEIGNKITIIGDDLFVTNTKRIKRGIDEKSANGVLIKLNQIGTVSETIDAITMAQKVGWTIAVSHRSGETEDSFIADLAYAVGADFIKTGSMSRSERLAKYNRLMEIERFEA